MDGRSALNGQIDSEKYNGIVCGGTADWQIFRPASLTVLL